MNPGILKERITLKRLNDATKTYDAIANGTVLAAAEGQPDASYRFRIRFRDDLQTDEDIYPGMFVEYPAGSGTDYRLQTVVVVSRRDETHLIAARVLVQQDELETGSKRRQAWP